jgi:hypothetical protein
MVQLGNFPSQKSIGTQIQMAEEALQARKPGTFIIVPGKYVFE